MGSVASALIHQTAATEDEQFNIWVILMRLALDKKETFSTIIPLGSLRLGSVFIYFIIIVMFIYHFTTISTTAKARVLTSTLMCFCWISHTFKDFFW